MTRRERLQHLIRANIAGGRALGVHAASRVLYEAGGKRILSHTTQAAVRELSSQGAVKLLVRVAPGAARLAERAAPPALGAGGHARSAALAVAAGGTRALSRAAAKAAGKEILRGAGKAAGLGLLLDGAVGGAEAFIGYRRGTLSARQAYAHVATEAATGAMASAAGVVVAAGLVAVTGGLAAPVVFAVGAAGAIATKLGLGAVLRRRRAVTVG